MPIAKEMLTACEVIETEESYIVKPPREFVEMDAKFAARMLLADRSRKLVEPTYEEWIGLNMLERDDELPRRKGD